MYLPNHQNPFEDAINYMARRKSSIPNEPQDMVPRKQTEEEAILNEIRRMKPERRDSIIPLEIVKEVAEVDQDGFKRPRECKQNEQNGISEQSNFISNIQIPPANSTRKDSLENVTMMLNQNNQGMISPLMQILSTPQPMMNPIMQYEERKENSPEKSDFRVTLPLSGSNQVQQNNNSYMQPALSTPLLNSSLYTPTSPQQFHLSNPYQYISQEYANAQQMQRNIAETMRKSSEFGGQMRLGDENLQPSYFYSPFMQPSPAFQQTPQPGTIEQQNIGQNPQIYQQHDEFKLDSNENNQNWKPQIPTSLPSEIPIIKTENALPERKIGTLTVTERRDKIAKYLEKRKRRIWKKKISYDCRKKVADKRLRIKGRFVTREQAYAILGTTAEDLQQNELLRTLVSSNNNCSIITSAQNMKIRNIQTLFMTSDKQKKQEQNHDKSVKQENPLSEPKTPAAQENIVKTEPVENGDKKKPEIRVEILKENARDQTVEIKIETMFKKGEQAQNERNEILNGLRNGKLPRIIEPIFQFRKIKLGELNECHSKYHKEVLGAF